MDNHYLHYHKNYPLSLSLSNVIIIILSVICITNHQPTQKDNGFPLEGGQSDNLFIGDKVQLVEHRVVLCQVLVLVGSLLTSEPGAVGWRH